jgi:hypothetical protein
MITVSETIDFGKRLHTGGDFIIQPLVFVLPEEHILFVHVVTPPKR